MGPPRTPSGMWEQSSPTNNMQSPTAKLAAAPVGSDFLNSAAALDFLQANKARGVSGDGMGSRHHSDRQGKEADIVDSLFGGVNGGGSGGLLQGIEGLSLSNNGSETNTTLNSGLWGSGADGLGSILDGVGLKDQSLYDSIGLKEQRQQQHPHHPEQSRFDWGTGHM